MGKNISNITETEKIAKNFAGNLNTGDVVFLYGNLGAGKTTFVKYILENYGYNGNVVSPTFVLEKKYKTENKQFYHLDLYRIKSADLNLLEFLNEKDKFGIYLIEWPELIEGIIKPDYKVYFEIVGENLRNIQIEKNV